MKTKFWTLNFFWEKIKIYQNLALSKFKQISLNKLNKFHFMSFNSKANFVFLIWSYFEMRVTQETLIFC